MELLANIPLVTTTCVALSEILAIEISYFNLKKELECNTQFLRVMSSEVALKALDNSNFLVNMAMESGESRLAAYIIQGSYKNVFIDTLSDVARSIGVSYRHLFRLLNKFVDKQIIKKDNHIYYILDEKELLRISQQ